MGVTSPGPVSAASQSGLRTPSRHGVPTGPEAGLSQPPNLLRSARVRLRACRGVGANTAPRDSTSGLQARPTCAAAVSPESKGKGPEPHPLPPQDPHRGRPLCARGCGPQAGSHVEGRAPLRRSSQHAGLQKTQGRARGVAGCRETRGCRPPRSGRERAVETWQEPRGGVSSVPIPPRGPAATPAVRPRGPPPFLRAEPAPTQPGPTRHSSQLLRAPPASEPSTWPRGRTDHPPPLLPSAPTCPPAPATSPHRRRRCRSVAVDSAAPTLSGR